MQTSVKMTRHAKTRAKTTIDANLMGPCGFYCGSCLAYRKGICLGCRYQADKNIVKGDDKFCTLLNCAEKKGVVMCSDCRMFPCKKQYNPDGTGMYSWTYFNYLRNEIKPD
jgi:hypothetical protein